MAADDTPQSHKDYAASEEKIFGKNPPRDRAGQPIEKGVGSPYASMHPSQKAHFAAQVVHVAADDVAAATKVLLDKVAALIAASKVAVDFAAKAKDAPSVVVTEPVPEPTPPVVVTPKPQPATTPIV